MVGCTREKVIKGRTMNYCGYVRTILRKKDDSIANLWNSTIEGKRPVGRPRSRWKDQVLKDVRRIKKDISSSFNLIPARRVEQNAQ
jgi:hypothetical protein